MSDAGAVGDRTNELFAEAVRLLDQDLKAIHVELAAIGAGPSSGHVKKALQAFEVRTTAALDQVLVETASKFEDRGRAWRDAMVAIADALSAHVASCWRLLSKPLKAAKVTQDSDAGRRVAQDIDNIGVRLQRRVADFRDGWTSPRAMKWAERHPTIHDLLIGVVGWAIIELTRKALNVFAGISI